MKYMYCCFFPITGIVMADRQKWMKRIEKMADDRETKRSYTMDFKRSRPKGQTRR